MLRILRDPKVDDARRDMMAKAAAPYLHPTYAAVQYQQVGPDGAPVGPRIVEVERVIEHRPDAGVLAETNPGVKDTRH